MDNMKDKIWCYLFFSISIRAIVCYNSTGKYSNFRRESNTKCWKAYRAQELLQFIEKIDKEYATVRDEAQKYLDKTNFTERMLEKISVDSDIDQRYNPEQRRYHAKIPSGTHLGGLCIMTLPNTVLFFHQMKLLNDAFFQVKDLHSDIDNMLFKGQLLLNSLHVIGAYDSSLKEDSPSILKHTLSFGELEGPVHILGDYALHRYPKYAHLGIMDENKFTIIFMEDVHYTIEGRYKLKKDRLVIELIVSTLDTKNITLTHTNANETDPPIMLDKQNMGDFMMRLKSDLDKWTQDYFNSYLSATSLEDVPSISKLREYDQHKDIQLTRFTDNALIRMNKKLRNIGGDTVRIPYFKITASHNVSIQVYAGTLGGLDTMYRRSQPTTFLKKSSLRYVDTIIGFRNLKISYAYKIIFPPGPRSQPTLTGLLIMSADQQTAHLALGLFNETEVLELDIEFLNRLGPDAIAIEGDASILMSNFKHILHHEIATIMSNSLTLSKQLLKSLPSCDLLGMVKPNIKLEIVKQNPRSKREPGQKVIGVEELKRTSKMMPTLTR